MSKYYKCKICGKKTWSKNFTCQQHSETAGRYERTKDIRNKISISQKTSPLVAKYHASRMGVKRPEHSIFLKKWWGDRPEERQKARERGLLLAQDKNYLEKLSKLLSGKNNPNWKNGLSTRPYKNFYKKLKAKIRERCDYTCQLCKKTEKELGYTLSIHHIDFNKENSNEENLNTLCKRCNSFINFDRDKWTKYFQEKMINIMKEDQMIKPYYENSHGKLFCGDALKTLQQMPNESVNAVITSPPYYKLRDYNIEGQIGLEETSQEYLKKLWAVFDEVKRVLRKDGVCFINLNDTYSNSGGSGKDQTKHKQFGKVQKINKYSTGTVPHIEKNYPRKCLLQIPSRFSIGMVERGWTLRNQIIWFKKNVMPQSSHDRFTVDYEPIFFFVKNEKYYFEQQFEKSNVSGTWHEPDKKYLIKTSGNGETSLHKGFNRLGNIGGVRNCRTVWSINTKPLMEEHYSSFPPELVQRMVLAGCPKDGVILDPFMGAGTTALVAQSLHRNWVGIDLSEKYCGIAKKRIGKFTSFWRR